MNIDTYEFPLNFVLNIVRSKYTSEDDEVEESVGCIELLDIPERIDFEEG